MRKPLAGALLLAALALGAVFANQAVERDRQYRRLIIEGDEALRQGEATVALQAFSDAIGLKPESMLGYLKRAEAHQRRSDTLEALSLALRDLLTAARLDATATRTLEELGDVNFRLTRYANAAESYNSYLQIDDHSARLFYKLGLALRADGRLAAAITALQKAVQLEPSFEEAHYTIGLCFKDKGQFSDARLALERAVRISPAFIAAREELADVYHTMNRNRDEIEQLAAVTALNPRSPERLVALALAYFHTGRRERALTELGLAAERFPDHSGVYGALGRVWLNAAEDTGDSTDLAKALEALSASVKQTPASSEVLGYYGRALALAGNEMEAEETFRQAAERFPLDPEMLPHYAAVAQRLGHLDTARSALMRYSMLVDEDGDEANRASRIGDLSLELDDIPSAIAWYQKSESLGLADASLLARLADAYYRAGQTDAARATLTRAMEKDSTDMTVRAVSRRVQAR